MPTRQQAHELCASVCNWLDYQVILGKEQLCKESFATFPLFEYLRHIHKYTIETEWKHPEASIQPPEGTRGRRKQVDIVLHTQGGANGQAALGWKAFELKWAFEDLIDRQNVFNDLVRLAMIRPGLPDVSQSISRYFVLAGHSATFTTMLDPTTEFPDELSNFLRIPEQINLAAPHNMPLEDYASIRVHLKHGNQISPQLQGYINAFSQRNYGTDRIPRQINQTLLGLHVSQNFACGIWKISMVTSRNPFFSLTQP